MGRYDAYRGRVGIDGGLGDEAFQIGTRNSTKRQAYELIMASPTRVKIDVMKLVLQVDSTYKLTLKETKYCIVSDVDSYDKRAVLLLPDESIKVGTYVRYRDKIYLTSSMKDNDEYPELEMLFCNYFIDFDGTTTRVRDGEDVFGEPNYVYSKTEGFSLPAVFTTKIYSALDNSPIPLPVGALYIYAPFMKEIPLKVNREFLVHGDKYKATTVNTIGLLQDTYTGEWYGKLEIRTQREQTEGERRV